MVKLSLIFLCFSLVLVEQSQAFILNHESVVKFVENAIEFVQNTINELLEEFQEAAKRERDSLEERSRVTDEDRRSFEKEVKLNPDANFAECYEYYEEFLENRYAPLEEALSCLDKKAEIIHRHVDELFQEVRRVHGLAQEIGQKSDECGWNFVCRIHVALNGGINTVAHLVRTFLPFTQKVISEHLENLSECGENIDNDIQEWNRHLKLYRTCVELEKLKVPSGSKGSTPSTYAPNLRDHLEPITPDDKN